MSDRRVRINTDSLPALPVGAACKFNTRVWGRVVESGNKYTVVGVVATLDEDCAWLVRELESGANTIERAENK